MTAVFVQPDHVLTSPCKPVNEFIFQLKRSNPKHAILNLNGQADIIIDSSHENQFLIEKYAVLSILWNRFPGGRGDDKTIPGRLVLVHHYPQYSLPKFLRHQSIYIKS